MRRVIILIAGILVLFNACKSDGSDPETVTIVGNWKLSNPGASAVAKPKKGFENVAAIATTTINTAIQQYKPDEVTVEFNASAFTVSAVDDGVKMDPVTGSYSLSGDKISLKISGSPAVDMDCTLTAKRLTLTKTVPLSELEAYLAIFGQLLGGEMTGNLSTILEQLNTQMVKNAVESVTLTLDFDRK